MSSATQARLRTKTGCLTCRKRRKKCDERLPVCRGCHRSNKHCQWPTSAELLDRRFASQKRSRQQTSVFKVQRAAAKSPPQIDRDDEDHDEALIVAVKRSRAAIESELCPLPESAAAHGVMSHGLELVISRHFVERFYGLLLLPKCHPGFHDGWLNEIQDLMVHHKSLYYSVLACAASHIHCIDASSRMQELALTYYSKALRELSRFLAKASQLENHNGLLMSVMLMYLHGCMGYGTDADIPRHLTAATRILTLRLFSRPFSINRLFDRLAVESVLYQIFLVTTGLWSDSAGLSYDFDIDFWIRAEKLLNRSLFFPERSTSFNSPVLGIPASLFRLNLSLRQMCRRKSEVEQETIDEIRSEVEVWEAALLCDQDLKFSTTSDRPNCQERYYRDAGYLYAIIASILLEQLERNEMSADSSPMPASDSWQVRKAVQILRGQQSDDGWPRCFIGNWPVYTLGFFMNSPEDIELIRVDLHRRWDLTNFSQISRFSRDLERTWLARGQSFGTALTEYF